MPRTGLHGDLKLANVAPLEDGGVALIDWQLMTLGPVAVGLGWLLVSNSAGLRQQPEAVMAVYHAAAVRAAGSRAGAGSCLGPRPLRRQGMERDLDRLPPRGLDATIGIGTRGST